MTDGALPDSDNPPIVPVGTLCHRHFKCPHVFAECKRRLIEKQAFGTLDGITEVRRQANEDPSMQSMIDSPLTLSWTRALVPSPVGRVPPPSKDGTFVWHTRPPEQRVGGWAYVDASGVDGPSMPLLRIGWAFAVFDPDGSLLAAAYGAVPSWVCSVAAGEAYALMMVIDVMLPGSRFFTDCLGSLTTARRGSRWATGPARPNARIWKRIFHAWDSDDDADKLLWIPSHCTAKDIGVRRASDGTAITAEHIRRNHFVDGLAKKGAHEHRVPETIRREVEEAMAATWWLAMLIGHSTAAANGRPEVPHRDSRPNETRRGSRIRRPRKREKAPVVPRPIHMGGHALMTTSSGWKCAVCRSTSTKFTAIARARCSGPAAAKWARRARELARAHHSADIVGTDGAGHRRFMTDQMVWCDRCGAYAESFAVGLARACPGHPTCAGKEQHLRRLRRGLHPATAVPFLGPPLPEPALGAHARPAAPVPARRDPWGSAVGLAGSASSTNDDHVMTPCAETSGQGAARRREAVASRIRGLRERIRARTASEQTTRRRITGKSSPSASSTAAAPATTEPTSRGLLAEGLVPTTGGDIKGTLANAYMDLNADDGHAPAARDGRADTKRRRIGHLSAWCADGDREGEVGRDQPEASERFTSRAQLIASLVTSANDQSAAHGCFESRGRVPASRIDAASDCLVDDAATGSEGVCGGAPNVLRAGTMGAGEFGADAKRRRTSRCDYDDVSRDMIPSQSSGDVARRPVALPAQREDGPVRCEPAVSHRPPKRQRMGSRCEAAPSPRVQFARATSSVPAADVPQLRWRTSDGHVAVPAFPRAVQFDRDDHHVQRPPRTRSQFVDSSSGNR